jgi:hypothetical protein
MYGGVFNLHHIHCPNISKLQGFSGTIAPGESTDVSVGASASTPNTKALDTPDAMGINDIPVLPSGTIAQNLIQEDTQEQLEAEEIEEDAVEEISQIMYEVLHVSND